MFTSRCSSLPLLPNQAQKAFAQTAFGCLLALLFPTSAIHAQPNNPNATKLDDGIHLVGEMKFPAIKESSGLVASRKYPGTLWTHNDQGNAPVLFAVDRSGSFLSLHRLQTLLLDWEDLATDDSGHLYVADIGNNENKRRSLRVLKIHEPDPAQKGTELEPLQTWELLFPQSSFDCESLFVDGERGYVISKVFDDAQGQLFSFDLKPNLDSQTLRLVATLPVTSPITGADLSPDRQRLGLVCKAGAYVFQIQGMIESVAQAPVYRNKYKEYQIEGCAFVPEGLLATAESREIILFSDPPYRGQP